MRGHPVLKCLLIFCIFIFLSSCSENATPQPDGSPSGSVAYSAHFRYDVPDYVIEADEYTVTPDVAVPTGGPTGGSVVVKQLGGLLSRSDPVEVNLVCNFLTAPNELLLFSWAYVEGNNAIYSYVVTNTPPGAIFDTNLVTNVDSYYDSSTGAVRTVVSLHTDRHDIIQYKCEVLLNDHQFAFDKFQLVFEAPQLRIMLHESGQDDLTNGTPIADSQEEGYLVAPEVNDGSYFIIGAVSLPQNSAFLTLTHNGNELGIRTEEVDEQVFIVSNDPVDLSTGSNEIIFEVEEGAGSAYLSYSRP